MIATIRRIATTRQALPLAAGFVVLLIISSASVWLVNRSDEDARLVSQTLELDGKLGELQLLMRSAESSQRGYLLTGDERYRAAYDTAKVTVEPTLAALRAAFAANPGQIAAITELEPIVRDKFAEMAETVRLYDSGARDNADRLVRTDQGRQLMRQALQIIQRLRAEEDAVLDSRRKDSAATSRMLLAVTLAGALFIVGLAALSIVMVGRSTQALRDAQVALAETNEGLEGIVAERTADLTEANEEIQRFAYIVSHDLRAPLVNIMGYTAELEALRSDMFQRLTELRESTAAGEAGSTKDDDLASDVDEALGFIKSSIGKMDRLINAILKLSREGRREFRPERIDMRAMMENIGNSLAHQASEADAEITASGMPSVVSDRLALEQIFSNLIDNALKYLRKGVPGKIEVSGRATPLGLVYDVKDNGRGIDQKDRERVFELFRRAGAQDRPGEGIGLAHVRTLVRRLGGSISVSSQPGEGSTFTVTLPRKWTGDKGKERKAA